MSECLYAPETCLCCVCCLRRSDEFGAAFEVSDECCGSCHVEMAVPEWPGHRCSQDQPTEAAMPPGSPQSQSAGTGDRE